MTDVSACFRAPSWCSSRWAPAWSLHTNLYKFGENVSPHILHKKNCCDLTLGESFYISTFFLFLDSRLNLCNGFYFLFWSILNGVTLQTSNSRHVPSKNLACCILPVKCLFLLWTIRFYKPVAGKMPPKIYFSFFSRNENFGKLGVRF